MQPKQGNEATMIHEVGSSSITSTGDLGQHMSNLQSWLLGLNLLISSMFQASQVPEFKAFKWPLEPKPFEAPSC
jgi:hypothetical protein